MNTNEKLFLSTGFCRCWPGLSWEHPLDNIIYPNREAGRLTHRKLSFCQLKLSHWKLLLLWLFFFFWPVKRIFQVILIFSRAIRVPEMLEIALSVGVYITLEVSKLWPVRQIWHSTCFYKVLLECCHAHLFTYCLCLFSCYQSGVVEQRLYHPQSLTIYSLVLHSKACCHPPHTVVKDADIIHKRCHFSYWYLTPLIFCLTWLTISSLFFSLSTCLDSQSLFFPQAPPLLSLVPGLRLHVLISLTLLCSFSFFSSPASARCPSLSISSHLSLLFLLLPLLSFLLLICASSGELVNSFDFRQSADFSPHRVIFFLLQHNLVLSSLFRASQPIWQGVYLTGKEREHVRISLHLGWLAGCPDWSVSNILKIILTMRSSATTSQTAQSLEMLISYFSPKDSISPCLWAQPLEF